MRTTLNLDDDVLSAARDRARRERRSVGEVISELVRAALTEPTAGPSGPPLHGFRPMPPPRSSGVERGDRRAARGRSRVRRGRSTSTSSWRCSTAITPTIGRPGSGWTRSEEACATPHHEFWQCEISLLDRQVVDRHRLHGPRQVTDAYLLALAVHRGGRFVTFDRSVVTSAVPGATAESLTVL